ncbi:unnamed protein product [Knipowitschia caucasica]|uniref:A disintegrin and metalloproteinase with thrombospondin motifs 2-like n=1 Tax=Knipowitschia caucasica TaxID=637954 RepID=A0AAV2J8W9_KNICA
MGLSLVLWFLCGLLQTSALLRSHSGSLHDFLLDFSLVRPIRTDSAGRILSDHAPRQRRHAPLPSPPEPDLFYNLTLQGEELRLHLRISTRLIAPGATLVWEESGETEPITEQQCVYTGHAPNDQRIKATLNVCHGLEGVIFSPHGDFYIEPVLQTGSIKVQPSSDQEHVVYRGSDLRQTNQSAAQQAPPTDFFRGLDPGPDPGLGTGLGLVLNPVLVPVLGSGLDSVHRTRRSTEAELFHIEVLLAVDYSVLLFHGRENIQRYLLTFMHIVSEIYQEPSLGANINIALVQINLLSAKKSQELIAVGDPQKSLQNVCTWSYYHQREQRDDLKHDLTIYLSRQEFGPSGMQGYAPVTGMCRLIRSCVLVMDDGFSSAFTAAHETGHVLGMEHDGDANACDDDVPLGSIMSPQVQASFYRYHWSRCSWRELHQYLSSYECLRNDPFLQSWPAQPQLPGFSYSTDQQCQYDWGHGYTTCTTYTVLDPCKQLWCSHYNDPFYCKTKKGPPLDGTRCGPGQHCFRGNCVYLSPHMMRIHGNWGKWAEFGPCSRSCRSGVQFRTRTCDNPRPANGGRICFGNSYEFRLCNRETHCPPHTDYRAEQCKVWNPFFEHNGTKHHWLPLQHHDPDERCRLFCVSMETGAVVDMGRVVHDGTLCSYEDQHSVCVRGDCEHVGCDGQIASDKEEDRCGICGGDNSSCRVIRGNYSRSARRDGFLKMLEIPKGARHLLVQEFKSTPHVLAVKNMDTGHIFLNDEHHLPESRWVVEGGVAWQYVNEGAESLQTSGPLSSSVLLMVRSHSNLTVSLSYKFVLQEAMRSALNSNLLLEDGMFYQWALKRWSVCSQLCGGGKQYTRFGCRRKADGKMVHRMFCSNISKPRAISRSCNREECSTAEWTVGPWQACSAPCGQSGSQRRWVSCQQVSSGGQQRSVASKLCGDNKPENKRSCNRHQCPASWRGGPWGQCSVSCGTGTQMRQVKCQSPDGLPGNCSAPRPITEQRCLGPPCSGSTAGEQKNAIVRWLSRHTAEGALSYNQRCRGDRSVFCQMEVLTRYCSLPGYRVMCCVSCAKLTNTTLTSNTTVTSNATLISNTVNSVKPQTVISKETSRIWTSHNSPVPQISLIFTPSDDITATEAPPPDDITATEAPPPDDITATEAPPTDDITATEAPPPDDITATEAPPPYDITETEAPPPEDVMTAEVPLPDDVIATEAPPPDDITETEAPPPEDVMTAEVPLPDDVIATEAPPSVDSPDFVEYENYDSDWTEPLVTMTSPITTTTTTKPKRLSGRAPPAGPEYTVVGVSTVVKRKLPHLSEKTQNKRIQELLREKRRGLEGAGL